MEEQTPAASCSYSMNRIHLILAILVTGSFLTAATFPIVSCSEQHIEADPFENFPEDETLAGAVRIVTKPFTSDTVFSFGDRKVETLQIARVFPTDYTDVFFSIRVFALKGQSAVNTGLARIISEDFSQVAGGDIYYNMSERTARAVTEEIDYYGKVFNDTILPLLRESIVNGFYVNVDLRPWWVSDDGDIYTYSSYMESCTGGGPSEIDCYYISISNRLGRALTFEDLVSPEKRLKVKEELLCRMAADANKTPEAYLRWLSDYLNPDGEGVMKVNNLPIYHVALYNGHLVFSYPQGTVAPVSKGCPLYFI